MLTTDFYDDINHQIAEATKNSDATKGKNVVRRLMTVTENQCDHFQCIIDAGIISNLIKLLDSSLDDELCKLVLNILLRISEENEIQKQAIIDESGISVLVKFLNSTNSHLFYLSIQTLAHIACGNDYQKKTVIDANVIPVFISVYNLSSKNISLKVAEALYNTLSDHDMTTQIADCFSISKLVKSLDPRFESACIFALQVLEIYSRGGILKKHRIINHIADLIKLLQNKNSKFYEEILEIFAALSLGNCKQKQILIKTGVVRHCVNIPESSNTYISMLAAETLGNIALGNNKQKQSLVNAGAIYFLFKLVSSRNSETCKLAMDALLKIFHGKIRKKRITIEKESILHMLKLIGSPYPQISITSITLLTIICAENKKQSQALLGAGLIPAFLKVLDSFFQPLNVHDKEKCDAAIILFTTIINNSQEQCKMVLMSGVLAMIEKAKGKSDRDYQYLINVTPCSKKPQNEDNIRICEQQIWAKEDLNEQFLTISNIKDSTNLNTAAEKTDLSESEIISRYITFISASNENLQKIALQAFLNFAKGTAVQKQTLINTGIIPFIINFLTSSDSVVRYSSLHILFLMSNNILEYNHTIFNKIFIFNLFTLLNSKDNKECFLAAQMFTNIAKSSFFMNIVEPKEFVILLQLFISINIEYSPISFVESSLRNILNGNTNETIKKTYLKYLVEKINGHHLVTLLCSSFPETSEFAMTLIYHFLIKRGAKERETIYQVEAIPVLIQLLNSTNKHYQILSILLSYSETHIQEVIEAGICPYIIKYSSFPVTKTSHAALLLLTKILLGTTKQMHLSIEAGAIAVIINFLKNTEISPKNEQLYGKIMMSFYNIYVEFPNEHQKIVQFGGIQAVAKLLNPKYKIVCRCAVYFLERISDSEIDNIQSIIQKCAFLLLTKLFYSNDLRAQITAINTACKISTSTAEQRKTFIEFDSTEIFVELLISPNTDILLLGLSLFEIFSEGPEEEKEVVINKNVLPFVGKLFHHADLTVCNMAAQIIQNISIEYPCGVQAIADAALIPHLLKLLSSQDNDLALRAAEIIKNIVTEAQEQMLTFVEANIISSLAELLNSLDENVCIRTLELIRIICHNNSSLLRKLVPHVTKFIHSNNAKIRENAIWVLINDSCVTVKMEQ